MPTGDFTKRLLGISMPIALSAYLRSGLVTVEHVLIPRADCAFTERTRRRRCRFTESYTEWCSRSCCSPAALCQTFASLIVPELSELKAKYKSVKESRHIKYIVSRSIKFGLLFAVFVAAVMIVFADELGMLVYKNELWENTSAFSARSFR
jgi:stage V sporulation protein B